MSKDTSGITKDLEMGMEEGASVDAKAVSMEKKQPSGAETMNPEDVIGRLQARADEPTEAAKIVAELKNYFLEQNINLMPDVEKFQEKYSMIKGSLPLPKLFGLGFLAGVWCGFAVILVLTIAGGIPVEVRSQWPCLPKLAAGFFFPVAIFLIIIFGGELFTGNAMVLLIGLFARRVTVMQLLYNWSVVLVSNFAGCVFTVYFFAHHTELFEHEPWNSYVQSIAIYKVNLPPQVVFLRAIPANALVCTSVLLGQLSRDMAGRLMAMWFPIMIFAVVGYEHAIANMAFVPAGLMCGADAVVDYRKWLYQNLLLAILGNVLGGGVAVGGTVFLLYNWTKAPAHHHGRHAPAPPAAAPALANVVFHRPRVQDDSSSPCSSASTAAADAAAAAPRAPLDLERVAAVFRLFDGDGDGRVSPGEALCALDSVGIRHTLHLLVAMIRAEDCGADLSPGEDAAAAAAAAAPPLAASLRVDLESFRRLATRLHNLERMGLLEA